MKILGISSILGLVNFVVTIVNMKHPDLPLMKIPLFRGESHPIRYDYSFHAYIFGSMIMMYTDRLGVSGFFNPAMGGDPLHTNTYSGLHSSGICVSASTF